MLTRAEVSRHTSKDCCWVIIKDHAYNVTDFLDYHPGGRETILAYAGKDATDAFEPLHSDDVLEKYMKPEQNLGKVTGTMPSTNSDTVTTVTKRNSNMDGPNRRPLRSIINLNDFEVAAAEALTPGAFAFFKSGADDENTVLWNQRSWQAIRFRPRILLPVNEVDISTSLLGTKMSAPFFICPAGGGKLANPNGEVLMTRAAGREGVLQWACNNAGCTQEQMASARVKGQTLYWQIYAKSDLSITEKEVRQAVALGYKGFALTVDAVYVGKRERDMRLSIAQSLNHAGQETEDEEEGLSAGVSVTRPPVYADFDWVTAIKWLRGITDLPIAIKGIQCWEDAALCMHYGVHPWLSNHGGRQLEGAPSALETLLEIRQHCPEVLQKCEVVVDGGITRGTDVVKALALGAKGVGLGRAYLYALMYGEPGITRAIRILKQEVKTAMALLGVCRVDQLNGSHVDASGVPYAASIIRARL